VRLPALAFGLFPLFSSGSAAACGPQGEYGLIFGSTPSNLGKKVDGSNASEWFIVEAPKPDPRFDRYEVRLDAQSREVLEIVAVKVITQPPENPNESLPPEKRKEGEAKAAAFAETYVASLPDEVRAKLKRDKYGTANWEGLVADGYYTKISAGFAWDVSISCLDTKREWAIARRVAPELFKKP